MRAVLFRFGLAGALVAIIACGGSGNSAASREATISISGCVMQAADGSLTLQPSSTANRAVGTSGREESYRLIDEGNLGVSRYVNREIQVTGKAEPARTPTNTAGATAGSAASVNLPTLRVTQLSGGSECSGAK